MIMAPTSEGDDSNTKTHDNGPYVRPLRQREMTLTLRLIIMDPTSEGDDSNTKTHDNGPYVRGRGL